MNNIAWLILVIPLLASGACLYRIWQVLSKATRFKNKFAQIFYTLSIFLLFLAFIFVWVVFFQDVWPGHLGKGEAVGKIIFSVFVAMLLVSFGYLVTEAIRSVCIRKNLHQP